MVRTLIFFLLFPAIVFAQPSWVNVSIFSDLYGGETSWEIYNGPEVVAQSSGVLFSNALSNSMVFYTTLSGTAYAVRSVRVGSG